jgi:hypothetical protein
MRTVERISYLVVVVSSDLMWEMGEEQFLKASSVGVDIISIKEEGSVGGWRGGLRGGGGCRDGEGEEGMVGQREARYREVLDMREEIQVGQDIVNHTGPLTMREVSKVT